MLLPNAWLWSMVDEFLYQFQSFAQYRAKLSSKSAEEIELLKKCDKVGISVSVTTVVMMIAMKIGMTMIIGESL
jgi:translation initiation factor 3 subunit L